jgi:hypothetical protein
MTTNQLPIQVYPLPDPNGFNILHEPNDEIPCEVGDDGLCHRIEHLWPLAKPQADA